MRYPALLSFQEALDKIGQFDTIIDTRSQSEFAEDHISGAVNCPVLSDEQRAEVGFLYKKVDTFEAKKLGAALISLNNSLHLRDFFLGKSRDWRPLVYCWRGGKRSSAMAHVMAEIGWPVAQIRGGYLEYRRHVNASLAELPKKFIFNVICGPTGSGKSRLLKVLSSQGKQVLDLEEIAAHRGSILGGLPGEIQPRQKSFESTIWEKMRSFSPEHPVFVESESRKIGNLQVPTALIEEMRNSTCILLDATITCRVKLLIEDYAHFLKDTSLLNTQLGYLERYHGYKKITHWQNLSSLGYTEELVEDLLSVHYDPAYSRSISRNFQYFPKARRVSITDMSQNTFEYIVKLLD